MANTKFITFYIFFLVFFNFFAGSFALSDESQNFELKKYMKITNIINQWDKSESIIGSVLKVVLIPFLLIDYVVVLIVLMSYGFTILPTAIEILIFTPIGIIITFDYILPYFRGN